MLCFNPYVCLFTAYVCRPYLINVLNDTAVDQLADWARRSVNAEELLALHSNTEASLSHLAKARQYDLRGRAGLWLAQSGLREALRRPLWPFTRRISAA